MYLKSYYTTKQAAKILKVNDSRVRQLILSGELFGQKFGHIWFIKKTDLNKYIKKRS